MAITSKVLQYIMACRKYPKFYIPNIFKRFGICPATTTKTQATPGLRGLHHFFKLLVLVRVPEAWTRTATKTAPARSKGKDEKH